MEEERQGLWGVENFGTPDETVTTSIGGIDAVALRVLMMVASQRGWTCGSTDIKSAFLQAPKRSAAHRVTLVKPPQLDNPVRGSCRLEQCGRQRVLCMV